MVSPLPEAANTHTFALIGNPNTGKTTLFNALTGLAQQVGNYPGVTVERKIGQIPLATDQRARIVDLPGTYSLAAASPDEMIAVDVIIGQRPEVDAVDAIVAIVDASNLRRNLYLVSQLTEAERPLVIALNMTDVARSRGIAVDADKLSQRLGVPVVPICASRRQGLEALKETMAAAVADRRGQLSTRPQPALPDSLQRGLQVLRQLQAADQAQQSPLSQVEALRILIDENGYAEQRLLANSQPQIRRQLVELRGQLNTESSLAAQESAARYQWIDALLDGVVQRPQQLQGNRSDRVDLVLTHQVVGLFFFLGVNALVFQSIFQWATPLMDGIEALFAYLGDQVGPALPPGPVRSLVVDGLFAGVGGVLVFLPQIAILFFFISLLEDVGYMARAAMLMDRLLTRCGLSGKSFIPLLSCFACAIPGIMAARTIQDRRDRFTTILIAPLMSCSARLPVYILFIAAFIPDRPFLGGWLGLQGLTLLGMYLLGAAVAIPIAWLLKKTLLRGKAPPFLMELPSYKWPNPQTVALRIYFSCKAFVVRAGSIILLTTVVMWALAYFPRPQSLLDNFQTQRQQALETHRGQPLEEALERIDRNQDAALLHASYLGRAGRFIEPLVLPLGWDWRLGMAALASFPAREVIISVMGTIYSLGGDQDEASEDLRQALVQSTDAQGHRHITIPTALSVMVFFALCAQCVSTIAVIQRETQSWFWACFSFTYMTFLAYAGAFVTYQIASRIPSFI